MSISIRQVEKVLRKAGVSYMRWNKSIDIAIDSVSMLLIIDTKDGLLLDVQQGLIAFKFTSLTSDKESLYFSFKGEEPLTVKIK